MKSARGKRAGLVIKAVMLFLVLACITAILSGPYFPTIWQLPALGWWILGSIPFLLVLFHRKKLRRVGLYGTISFIILLVGMEMGLGEARFRNAFFPMNESPSLEPDPHLFWKLKNSERINPEIFQKYGDPMHSFVGRKKAGGHQSIIVMGGSTVYGIGVNGIEKTLTGVMDKLTREKFPGKDIEFISSGVPGYTTFQNLVLYKLYIRYYRPDLIILYCNINDSEELKGPYTFRELFKMRTATDISDLWITDFNFPKRRSMLTQVQDLFHKANAYQYLANWITDIRADSLPESSGVVKLVNPVEDYHQNLEDLARIVKKDGVKIVFADAYISPRPGEQVRTDSPQRSAMMEVAKDMGVPYIPVHLLLKENFTPDQLVIDDWIHLNEFGHQKVGQIIFDVLLDERLI